MDSARFDGLTRDLWQSQTRRRLMRRLIILPGLGLIATQLPDLAEGDAAHPGHRRRARRRRENRRETQRGGLGAGSGDCTANRRRGELCDDQCECLGAYRCGASRLANQRTECGQDEGFASDQHVCCLGQGDSCTGSNDCECCGTLSCHLGRCRVRDGAACAPGKVHRRGECVGNARCTGDREEPGECGPDACAEGVWGPDARTACVMTAEEGRVCVGLPSIESAEGYAPHRCTQTSDCDANEVCTRSVFLTWAPYVCIPLCG